MKVAHVVLAAIFVAAPASENVALRKDKLEAVGASVEVKKVDGVEAVRVVMDPSVKDFDQPTFAKVKGVELKDGVIEVRVRSKLLPNAAEFARGFIGLTFRINEKNSQFEGIYLRPQNARVNDQVRRNHSTQYFSFPTYDFDKLRKDSPGVYESYVDMEMEKWIKMKIVVTGEHAQLFVNDSAQPVLVVNDLKHGAGSAGAVGLWVGPGTEGWFSDLKVSAK